MKMSDNSMFAFIALCITTYACAKSCNSSVTEARQTIMHVEKLREDLRNVRDELRKAKEFADLQDRFIAGQNEQIKELKGQGDRPVVAPEGEGS